MLKTTITIPSVQKTGKPVENRDSVIRAVCAKMSRAFGGCTLVSGSGHWQDANGKNVQENVTVATSYVTGETIETAEETIIDMGRWLKECCNQAMVLVTVETVKNVIFV